MIWMQILWIIIRSSYVCITSHQQDAFHKQKSVWSGSELQGRKWVNTGRSNLSNPPKTHNLFQIPHLQWFHIHTFTSTQLLIDAQQCTIPTHWTSGRGVFPIMSLMSTCFLGFPSSQSFTEAFHPLFKVRASSQTAQSFLTEWYERMDWMSRGCKENVWFNKNQAITEMVGCTAATLRIEPDAKSFGEAAQGHPTGSIIITQPTLQIRILNKSFCVIEL